MTQSAAPLLDDFNVAPIGPRIDGRRLRRQKNRDAVIASLIALIRDGNASPTTEQIADGADVSHRSIFRYFDDLDDLTKTAFEEVTQEALPLALITSIGEGTLHHRISEMIDARMRILNFTAVYIRAALGKAACLPEIEAGLLQVAELTCAQIRQQFAAELSLMQHDESEQIVALLSSELSFYGYEHHSRIIGRTDAEITGLWAFFLHRLLT